MSRRAQLAKQIENIPVMRDHTSVQRALAAVADPTTAPETRDKLVDTLTGMVVHAETAGAALWGSYLRMGGKP